MKDWRVLSSSNLLDWKLESVLKPEETYIGKPIDGCWATDAIEKNGKYYWCFSEVDNTSGHHQIGLMVGDTPAGPWKDVLGAPLLTNRCVETEVYDPCFFKEDNGDVFILFGVWDYYIARMSGDVLSLAEEPRKIEVVNPEGPYGKEKTDDKIFLHKQNGLYYLSWGSYYATSAVLEGPYTCRGCFVDPGKIEKRFKKTTWPHGPTQGRHGSFFEWNGQSFFAYCEMCFSGNRYHRDFWISYIHYRKNGDIEPIAINSDAVGTYRLNSDPIPAANYFKAHKASKQEEQPGEYEVQMHGCGSSLEFPNLIGGKGFSFLVMNVQAEGENPVLIIEGNGDSGPRKTLQEMNLTWISGKGYQTINCPLEESLEDPESIVLRLSGSSDSTVAIKWLQILH